MKIVARKNTLPIIHDDIFNHITQYVKDQSKGCSVIVPHVCNNVNVFGAGFAAAVARHYPIVKENYHLLGPSFLKNHLGYTQFVDAYKNPHTGHKLIFANMIAQHGTISQSNPRPLNYYALTKGMVGVLNYIHNHFGQDSDVQIHAPKFGCGLAGGNWNFIEELIKDIWNNQTVFIYQK